MTIMQSQQRWVALLGQRDAPTDGVEDYCIFLARALAADGIDMQLARVQWVENGWIAALRQLSRASAEWRGRCVLLQYTAFSWSRRGFPFGAVAALAILRQGGVRCAVVFHEQHRQSKISTRWIDRIRGVCQDWVIHKLYKMAAKSIFTVPLETIAWLPQGKNKAAFIPIGANIPERTQRRVAQAKPANEKTVIVFGVSDSMQTAAPEVKDISDVMLAACKALGRGLRLVVVGRGALEARELLTTALQGSDVGLAVRGVLPAEELADEFASADVMLTVRGPITPRRGSAMAGIAAGVPIVGYCDGNIDGPLQQAGVEWAPWKDRHSLSQGLIRVLSDPQRWTELHERNLEVQKSNISWSRIADRFQAVLAG
jgi:glycosyltransferase involved in cell wall biosynthesis